MSETGDQPPSTPSGSSPPSRTAGTAASRGDERNHGGASPRLTLFGAGVIGAVVGAVALFVLIVVLAGNPFSSTNEVQFRRITVASVTEEEDSVCWRVDPERRDSPQECAVLALDPAASLPERGERLVVGVLILDPPDGDAIRHLVYLERVDEPAATDEDPDAGADDDARDTNGGE